jgi:hypothetical protein
MSPITSIREVPYQSGTGDGRAMYGAVHSSDRAAIEVAGHHFFFSFLTNS